MLEVANKQEAVAEVTRVVAEKVRAFDLGVYGTLQNAFAQEVFRRWVEDRIIEAYAKLTRGTSFGLLTDDERDAIFDDVERKTY